MNKKPSQATRVLVSLGHAGSRGITQGDWLQTGGVDGRGRITRVAARVEELRGEGLAIVADGKRDGFAVYRLIREASSEPSQQLFNDISADRDTSHWKAA